MPLVTIIYGGLLILVGVIGYFATGGASVTALIPAFIGLPVEALGVLARSEKYLKHAMHGAAGLALLATFGTVRGLLQLPALFAGEVERAPAVISQAIVAALSIVFLALCVRSFIAARQARDAA